MILLLRQSQTGRSASSKDKQEKRKARNEKEDREKIGDKKNSGAGEGCGTMYAD